MHFGEAVLSPDVALFDKLIKVYQLQDCVTRNRDGWHVVEDRRPSHTAMMRRKLKASLPAANVEVYSANNQFHVLLCVVFAATHCRLTLILQ